MNEMKAQRPNRARGRGAALEATDARAAGRLLAAARARGGRRIGKADLVPDRVEAKVAALRAQLAKG